ncbi:hypothetical protein KEJ17_03255, partial [Candidatus Bathyarchaeota archaeon]|nr:hypothetical protein [Candidatus Bathyarchaeota archaeon]
PIQRFRITPTSKSALFRAKRWFYSTFYTNAPSEVKEENRKIWVDLAAKLVEEINKRNAVEKPARLVINYETGPRGEFKPLSATVELMEIRPLETFTIFTSKEEERKKLKAELEELIKKARDLGISLKELEEAP